MIRSVMYARSRSKPPALNRRFFFETRWRSGFPIFRIRCPKKPDDPERPPPSRPPPPPPPPPPPSSSSSSSSPSSSSSSRTSPIEPPPAASRSRRTSSGSADAKVTSRTKSAENFLWCLSEEAPSISAFGSTTVSSSSSAHTQSAFIQNESIFRFFDGSPS